MKTFIEMLSKTRTHNNRINNKTTKTTFAHKIKTTFAYKTTKKTFAYKTTKATFVYKTTETKFAYKTTETFALHAYKRTKTTLTKIKLFI